jgi:YHYH protein
MAGSAVFHRPTRQGLCCAAHRVVGDTFDCRAVAVAHLNHGVALHIITVSVRTQPATLRSQRSGSIFAMSKVFFAMCMLAACLLNPHARAHNDRKLPLGDGKWSASQAQRGHVLVCSTRFPGGGGAHRVGEWIDRDNAVWWPSKKPVVPGDVAWPQSTIAVSREAGERIVRANNLPTHATGEFPIGAGTAAYQYDRNPNRIAEQPILLRLPAEPVLLPEPACVPMGMVGFALSGVAIFNAFDLAGRDAPAYEIQDRCNGHPERSGQYHYHDWSPCIDDNAGRRGEHSSLVGWMLDGFPIFGPRGEGGRELSNADLDECHGHTHEVLIDGQRQRSYHYHFTHEYPYTIGCFRAKPLRGPAPPAQAPSPPRDMPSR